MSLINEALKEAQRERSERSGRRDGGEAGDAFFPFPLRGKGRRLSPLLVIGGLAVVVLVVGGATMLHRRTNAPTRTAIPSPVLAAVVPLPVTKKPAAPVAVAPKTSFVAQVPPRAKPDLPGGASKKPAAVDTHQQAAASPKTSGVKDSSARQVDTPTRTAAPLASPPATAPIVQPQGTAAGGGGGVHVIVDPNGTRPADSLFRQAYAEHMRNNLDRAQELYEKVIALPQASAEAFNDYGALLSQRGNQIAATQMFLQAIKRDDRNIDAWVNLGDAYNVIGHHVEAMSAYARATQLDPSSVAAKVRLAAEYQAINDTASARRIYEDAVKIAPKDANVHYEYGKYLQTQREIRAAIREYQLFVDLAPGKYAQENIDDVKHHIAGLRRLAP